MKKESGKKTQKWLWLVIALAAVLVIAGIILAVLLLPGRQDTSADTGEAKLYWNVGREAYIEEETGMSIREKGDDGFYHILFAVDGEQVELPVSDKQLVNYIDTMDLMGLVFGKDGTVVDALDPKTVATETAKEFYVKQVQEDTITLNSSILMNGMDMEIAVTDKLGIYNVDPTAEMIGQVDECEQVDLVWVFSDENGDATHLFILERAVQAEVYYRIESLYDTAQGTTTREPDENGVYTIAFAYEGEQVDLKCRDKDLVSRIDALTTYYNSVGLLFDDEGYIVDFVDANLALRGILSYKGWSITNIEGDTYYVERIMSGGKEQGMTDTFTLADDCDVFIVEDGCGHFIGERTELQVGDRIYGYTDFEGELLLAYVQRRTVDVPMYYNYSRKYDSALGETTRTPDEKGYYVFEMAVNGGTVTLRTKDKTIASLADSNSAMGLKVDGNIIQAVYHASCVCGYGSIITNGYVNSLMGTLAGFATATQLSKGETGSSALLTDSTEVYDLTGVYGIEMGAVTTLQVGDRVTVYRDVAGNITHVYVLGRYYEGTKVYYNVSRKYNSADKVTTREPDENGYYVFEMVCEGKTVTVKTKSKDMATYIDACSAPIVALKVGSDGIVRSAYPAESSVKWGFRVANRYYISDISADGKTFDTYYTSNGEKKVASTHEFTLADDCVVYNVSSGYKNYRGEKTTLQENDQIVAIWDRSKFEVVQIFVLSRRVDSELYWHVSRKYNSTTGETRRQPDADGWYVFDLAVNGKIKQFKTKDKTVASEVDALSPSAAFGLILDGDIILRAISATSTKAVSSAPAGHRDVMAINGNKITLVRNRPAAEDLGATTELTLAKDCKIYNVSRYAENFGAETTLKLGDRVKCYANADGEVVYCFVVYENTHTAGYISYCQHCGKDVFWEPFDGTIYEADAHYYLTHDYGMSKQMTVGSAEDVTKNYDIVLDLNGHCLSSAGRNFLVYGTLSVLDSVGGGEMTAAGVGGYGGNVMVIQGGTLNIYGGTLTSARDNADSKNGGVLFVNSGSTVNMYGGTVTGGHVSGIGGNIYLNNSTFNMSGGTVSGGIAQGNGSGIYLASSKVNITGGTVSGDVYVNTGTELKLSGAPVISGTGLQFAGGVKLSAAELTKGASVAVSANGAFTEVLKNAESCKAFFTPALSCAYIDALDGVLYCQIDFTAPLAFEAGTTKAGCPACAKTVEWTALTAESTTLVKGGHYYLAEDITYQGTQAFLKATTSEDDRGTVCLHLNGHDITAEKALAIEVCKGSWNIMGSGTVSGNRSSSSTTAAATLEAIYAAGRVNLYGGTFVKAQDNTTNPVMVQRNGIIYMHSSAAIESTDSSLRLYVTNGGDTPQFYMYGGSISGGSVHVDAGSFKLSGGTVNGDIALGSMDVNKSSTDKTQTTCYATLDMSGGSVTGSVDVTVADTVTLSGASVISGCLSVAQGAAVTVGELTDGAAIVVFANGTFAQSDNAEGCSTYFRPAVEGDTIAVDENALVYTMQECTVTEELAFINDSNKAVCAVCNKVVTWIPLDQATCGETGCGTVKNNGDHFYLAEDITYTGTSAAFITAPGQITDTTGKIACLHLNGHNITATANWAVMGSSGILNILGTGTVSGNYTNASVDRGSTLYINNNKVMGAINLYSGTYVQAEGNTQNSAVSIMDNGGKIAVFADAKLVGNVHVGTAKMRDADFVIDGGTVEGSVYMAGANAETGYSSTFTMTGGSVSEVTLETNNGAVLSGAPVIGKMTLADGVKLTLGELVDGTSIVVSASGVFTNAHDKAEDYVKYFTPAGQTVKIAVRNKALSCEKDYLGDLKFKENTAKAVCPVCETEVEWIALTAEATTLVKGNHYYLNGDITYEEAKAYLSGTTAESERGTVCLHLNGHSITATKHRAINLCKATLNVMGTGTVSGNFTGNINQGATLYAGYAAGKLNLYGGTFTKAAGNTTHLSVTQLNGIINLYDGAAIENGYKIFVSNATDTPKFNVNGGTVTGKADITAGTVTLSGAPKLTNLVVADGVKLNLGELTEGADITVSAAGVFTTVNANAAAYVGYFKPTAEGDAITAEENTLRYVEAEN